VIKNNLTRNNIVKNLSNKTGFSLNFSKKLVDDLLDILIKNIKNEKFILKNIGTFKLIDKKERFGRNPKTRKEFIISSRKSLVFIASKKILDILNSN
jgi:nucleoid DNA-binding protein